MPPSGVDEIPDGDASASYQAYRFKDNYTLKDGLNT